MNILRQSIHYGPSFRYARVEETVLPLPVGCAFPEGRTLLFFSDVHLSDAFPHAAVERLLMQIDALHPDMLLLGGDYAESVDWQRDFFRMLGQLRPPLGMYAALGNNDRECFPDSCEPLAEIMDQAGVELLVNRTARRVIEGVPFAIAGTDELHYSAPYDRPLFDERDCPAFRLLLAHYPQAALRQTALCPALPPHLCLSGHTHAGQFRLLGLTPYSIGFERGLHGLSLPAVRGWTKINGAPLLVSPGLGTSRIPLRVNAEPTIHLIRPVAAEK